MLQTQTVEPRALEILDILMQMPELSDCLLVGGTNLSLHYGHRLSDDLDLFSTAPFDIENVIRSLELKFPNLTYKIAVNVGIFGFIDDIKVDFVQYHEQPVIERPHTDGHIRLMSTPDVVARKVNAIMKRGVKKDFWDVAELLDHYSVENFIEFYSRKYPSQQLMISVPQAMVYFDDAEDSEMPRSLKEQTWETVKERIRLKVREFLE